MSEIFEKLEIITDEKSFLEFLMLLSEDYNCNTFEWQNTDVSSYLEATYDWGRASIEGLEFYRKPDNIWKRCAEILYMGKIYE